MINYCISVDYSSDKAHNYYAKRFSRFYPIEMADVGQPATASWRLFVFSVGWKVTMDMPSSSISKTSGQIETHRPQPMHKSRSTETFILSILSAFAQTVVLTIILLFEYDPNNHF
jgi:hypothetical protein